MKPSIKQFFLLALLSLVVPYSKLIAFDGEKKEKAVDGHKYKYRATSTCDYGSYRKHKKICNKKRSTSMTDKVNTRVKQMLYNNTKSNAEQTLCNARSNFEKVEKLGAQLKELSPADTVKQEELRQRLILLEELGYACLRNVFLCNDLDSRVMQEAEELLGRPCTAHNLTSYKEALAASIKRKDKRVLALERLTKQAEELGMQ